MLDEDAGSADWARRSHAIGGGVSALNRAARGERPGRARRGASVRIWRRRRRGQQWIHRAARGERPGRARCRRRGERRHRSQVGAGRGSREGRRASAVSAQGRASRSRSDDALFYLRMRNDNNALWTIKSTKKNFFAEVLEGIGNYYKVFPSMVKRLSILQYFQAW